MVVKNNNLPNVYEQYIDYQDTDAGGVVYHGSYINFAERARAKLFRELFSNLDFNSYLWVVTDLVAKYVSPAKLGDFITLKTGIKDIKNCSITLTQDIFVKNKLMVTILVKIVSLNQDFKIVRFNNILKETLINYYKENIANE